MGTGVVGRNVGVCEVGGSVGSGVDGGGVRRRRRACDGDGVVGDSVDGGGVGMKVGNPVVGVGEEG